MGSDDSDAEVDNRDRVLAPDDLDITKQPEVEEIDDGRYVVSPSGPAEKPDRDLLENPDWLDNDDEETAEQSTRQPPANTDRSQPAGGQPSTDRQPSGQPPADRQSGRQSTTQNPQRGPSQSPPPDQSSARGTPTTNQSQPPSQPASEESTPRGQPSADHPNQGPQQPQNSQQPHRTQQSQNSQPSQQPQNPPRSQQPQNSQPQQSQRSRQPQQSTPSRANQSTPKPPNQSKRQASQSTGRRTDKPQNRELAAHNQPPAEPPAAEITNENVSTFLAKSLANASGDYGFDATVNVEGNVNRGRMTSDDIGETLETLLRWYAKQTTDEVEPEHVLGIILAGSDLAVEYPVQSAYEVVKQHGLGPDDTISDLLAAVRQDGSFTVPPSDE